MISKEEKNRGLIEEKWERHNLYYIISSILIAIFAFSWLRSGIYTPVGEIVRVWKEHTLTNLVVYLLPLCLIIFLIYKATTRMSRIEQMANNWEQANDLGRGMIKWARIIFIIAMIFWILNIGIIYHAFNHLSKY